MTGVFIAAAIVGIIATVTGQAMSIYQLGVQHLSSNVRKLVTDIAGQINRELKAGRLNVNKLISVIQSKNANALMTYLYNNPVISKRLDEVQSNSDLVASLQAEQNSLETEIANLQNELNSLGYQTSISGSIHDDKRARQIRDELKQKGKEYENFAERIKSTDLSTVRKSNTYTSDIDARSQNITGGLVK